MNSSKNLTANLIRILSAAAVLAMLIICVAVYRAPVTDVLIFLCFLLFYVQLPGLLIIRAAGIRPEHASSTLVIGLFTGWSLMMLLYFVTDFIGTNILLYTIAPALSLIYIIICMRGSGTYRGRHHIEEEHRGFVMQTVSLRDVSPAFCVFFAMSLLFILLKTQYVYMSPDHCDYIYMNVDKAYHMGLLNGTQGVI